MTFWSHTGTWYSPPTNEALSGLPEHPGSHAWCPASCWSLSEPAGSPGHWCPCVLHIVKKLLRWGRWSCCRTGLDNAKFKYQERSVKAAYLLNVSVPKRSSASWYLTLSTGPDMFDATFLLKEGSVLQKSHLQNTKKSIYSEDYWPRHSFLTFTWKKFLQTWLCSMRSRS